MNIELAQLEVQPRPPYSDLIIHLRAPDGARKALQWSIAHGISIEAIAAALRKIAHELEAETRA